jgi:phosphatidyl-myo-inositol dimannoside synthase
MRFLLIAENWPPSVGGIENYLSHVSSYLPRDSVTVVAPLTHGDEPRYPGLGIDEVIRKRFFWPPLRPKWLPLFITLFRLARRERYSAVLCGKALFEGLIGYYLNRHLGIPYIVFTYAMEIETWATEPRQRRKLVRVLCNAHRIVYINDVTKKTLLDLGATERQLVKITPGVNKRFTQNVSEHLVDASVRRYNMSRPYILSVGRLVHRKGFDTLIEAFAKLDQTTFGDHSLVIIGDGPERDHLKELADELFVSTSVTFLTSIPDKDLPALYTGAQVFALTPRQLPTDYDGFGIVYLEAAACGVPAIATKSGGAQEAVLHNKTGFVVPPDNPQAVHDALATLLSDTSLHDRLAKQAKLRARSEFMWEEKAQILQATLGEFK